MPRVWTILTPENVPLELELANPLERGVALMIDTVIVSVLSLTIAAILTFLSGAGTFGTILGLGELETGARFALLYAFAFPLLLVAYHSLFESLWGGRTLGKKLLNIRVIRTDGTVPDLAASLIRNALRFIDYMPCTCGVGLTVMLLSAQFRRLGDYAAGTLVIREGRKATPILPEEELTPMDLQVLTPFAVANIGRLTEEQFLGLRYFLLRADQLSPELRQKFAKEIADKVANLLWNGNPPENLPAERLIEEVIWLYRQGFKRG
ncbi:MAG: RDD family protein [Armatimonadetes bacterium]|nr:RDD family protein [Armatimonadota bacterium]MDW8029640.1 RDD family protein [Armatimonadota bacterium]